MLPHHPGIAISSMSIRSPIVAEVVASGNLPGSPAVALFNEPAAAGLAQRCSMSEFHVNSMNARFCDSWCEPSDAKEALNRFQNKIHDL